MPSFILSSPSKKLQKSTSVKKIFKQLLSPVKLFIVPHTQHATTNQAYSTYYSRRADSDNDKMYADLMKKTVYKSKERSVALSVNDGNSSFNVDDPLRESKHRDFDGLVDDTIFEEFIRRNRELFVREKEETARLSIGKQGNSGHYVMDDWIFEDFIRRNRSRFQHEEEEIISIDDYSDDELDDLVA